MLSYVLRRLVSSLLVVLVIITGSFTMVRMVPGNPFAKDRSVDEASMANRLAAYHLDKPIFPVYLTPDPAEQEALPIVWATPPAEVVVGPVHVVYGPPDIAQTQYVHYMMGLARFDLGQSMSQDPTVAEILKQSVGYSLHLGVQALLVALLIGIPAGLVAGLKQNRWQDFVAMGAAMFGVSVPSFVLGPLLILVFALGLGWFRTGGWESWSDSVLPSVALGVYYAAYIARLTRSGMLEIIRQDYIRTARAKGLVERVVVLRHALKGALLPVVSFLGPAFAGMLTGSVVIEEVFALPGIGSHFVRAAFARDYNLVLGVVILYSALLVLLNVVVDLMYTVLDPRVSYD
jgi:oligopeptide transport system permease protein